jgi:hypothetical protein
VDGVDSEDRVVVDEFACSIYPVSPSTSDLLLVTY